MILAARKSGTKFGLQPFQNHFFYPSCAPMVDEQLFNAYGFVLAFVGFGVLVLGAVWVMRERRPPAVASCGFLVALALCGFVTFWLLGLFEYPSAWAFTILRMPSAKSVKGVRVSEIVRGDAHWVTDDYFCGICGDHDNLLALRLETSSNRSDYYFAYDSRTREIVPMTIAAAGKFPEFMPDGDDLVAVSTLNGGKRGGGQMGNNLLELPAKWFQAAVRPDH
jgi:hypothetical protein